MDAPVENPWTNGSSYKINGKDEEYSSKRLSLVYCAKFEMQQNQAAQEHWITELKRSESKEFDLTEDEVLLLSQYRIEDTNDKRWINLVFSIENGLWPLPYILRCIMNENGQIKHLETRPSKKENYSFDVLIKVELSKNELLNVIKFVRSNHGIYLHGIPREELVLKEIWFPKHISDLDKCTHVLSHLEPDLESDHPGFNDVIYRTRRQEIADISSKYKYGHVIPPIKYTEDEIKTWGIVFKKMRKLHSKYACSQYRKCFRMLEEELNFNPDCIPQMQDISMFLKRKTGFTLRPASGLVTARDFLASLAFRVFQCTQYVRHSCKPDHSPEPDENKIDICDKIFTSSFNTWAALIFSTWGCRRLVFLAFDKTSLECIAEVFLGVLIDGDIDELEGLLEF
ncbi:tyrosine 3-monooxygenase [Caerostris extrusa]|uniref:Tyrosine 3-monooxygenase n=1 Tax=Caerostris extrusa TaxID=172846 RepID=A0AAV4UFX9_CAEEX|nr:tyrosine 3-monooxygenase [Caerostris extrusa]